MGFDKEISFYLFARPSFWEGFARTLDIGGHFDSYNESTTSRQADDRALQQDWSIIGIDIQKAIGEYAKENERKVVA